MKKIANIINFVRSAEPRAEDDSFLFDTLREALELCKRYGFRSTVLLQYDALIRPEYQSLVREYDVELGLWLEVVGPQAADAGIAWRGRYPVWDWDVRCTFLSGYMPEERERLLDTAFSRFREIFGAYPRVAGCWTVDAHSLAYMYETYGLKAFCNCRDQFGTDGITMWGGVYNGGYYPSRKNALLPAQRAENQIPLPVFRMLGPDPIYQYDLGLGDPEARQAVCTLEPVYAEGGGSPRWVEWYLNENYGPLALSHAYAQFGQENSFGWESISRGLPMQFAKLAERVRAGQIELLTLGETGAWFSSRFKTTPANCLGAASDWKENGCRTLWYHSRYYRVNVLYQNGAAWIRDLQLYCDGYAEQYLSTANTAENCGNFALPVIDGFRFSKDGVRAGIYPYVKDIHFTSDAPFTLEARPPASASAAFGALRFAASERALSVNCSAPGFRLRFVCARVGSLPFRAVAEKELSLGFSGFSDTEFRYTLRLGAGRFAETDRGVEVLPDAAGLIEFQF